jgi:predicted nucleic acid-binding protein
MRFWDSSAVVPLVIDEPTSRALDDAFRSGAMVVWWGTLVEVSSALARREHAGRLSASNSTQGVSLLQDLAAAWQEISPTDAIRRSAQRLLRVHALRAADSLQLAAALTAAAGEPSGVEFVCLDSRLRHAAAREGFRLLPELLEET